jgi:hypothetical protein
LGKDEADVIGLAAPGMDAATPVSEGAAADATGTPVSDAPVAAADDDGMVGVSLLLAAAIG